MLKQTATLAAFASLDASASSMSVPFVKTRKSQSVALEQTHVHTRERFAAEQGESVDHNSSLGRSLDDFIEVVTTILFPGVASCIEIAAHRRAHQDDEGGLGVAGTLPGAHLAPPCRSSPPG
jgi:hypothetical protein